MEVGGSGTINESIQCLRNGGNLGLVGVLTGMKAEMNLFRIFQVATHVLPPELC